MRILYLDTSSSYLYSAIFNNNNSLAEVKKEFGQNLSEESLPEISNLFNKANIKPEEIDKIIVVNGPGSFTGVRIGITIAKIYAWAMNIDITTITSLDAMSVSCRNKTYKVPMIDARRKYVYAAIYDENDNIVFKPSHILLEDFKKEIEKLDNYTIISNDEFDFCSEIYKYDPSFIDIINKNKDKEPVNPHSVNPEYLKLTEAEEKLNK